MTPPKIPPQPQPQEQNLDGISEDTIDMYLKQSEQPGAVVSHSPILSDFLKKFERGKINSLDNPQELSSEQLMVLVGNLMNKLSLLMAKTTETSIKLRQVKQKDSYEKHKAEVKKQREKAHKAKKSGLLAKIFGWIAAAISVIAAAVVAVVSFGAAAPLVGVVAIASAAIAVTMTVLTQTGAMQKMMQPMINGFMESFIAMGLDPKKAKLAANIMGQVVVAAVVITAQIAMTVLTGGASSVNLANKFITTCVKVAGKFATYASKAIGYTATAANITSATATAAMGASSIATGAYQKEALDAQASATLLQAMVDQLGRDMERMRDFIAMLIKFISSNNGLVADNLDLHRRTVESVRTHHRDFA